MNLYLGCLNLYFTSLSIKKPLLIKYRPAAAMCGAKSKGRPVAPVNKGISDNRHQGGGEGTFINRRWRLIKDSQGLEVEVIAQIGKKI